METIYIIDTSSIIAVRRLPNSMKHKVFRALEVMLQSGKLVFPAEVFKELERYTDKKEEDLPYQLAKKNLAHATRYGSDFDALREVLDNPQVARVVDSEKTGAEDADPYVLALASKLKHEAKSVVIITEDRKDYPYKLSMTTACGLLRLVVLPIVTFMIQEGIISQGDIEGVGIAG